MKIFSPLYEACMRWSRHPKARWFLAALAFAEASFFPIPPDVMIAPMSMAQPKKWWKIAAWAALFSAIGGLAGYAIGHYGFDLIHAWLEQSKYWAGYQRAVSWFEEWGILAVALAGFSPIPYKVFTVAAGVVHMSLIPFFIASFLSRGARFILVAALMAWGGPAMEATLQKYVERLGWATVALALVGVVVYKI